MVMLAQIIGSNARLAREAQNERDRRSDVSLASENVALVVLLL